MNFHILALGTGDFTLEIDEFKEGFDKSLSGIYKFAENAVCNDKIVRKPLQPPTPALFK